MDKSGASKVTFQHEVCKLCESIRSALTEIARLIRFRHFCEEALATLDIHRQYFFNISKFFFSLSNVVLSWQ